MCSNSFHAKSYIFWDKSMKTTSGSSYAALYHHSACVEVINSLVVFGHRPDLSIHCNYPHPVKKQPVYLVLHVRCRHLSHRLKVAGRSQWFFHYGYCGLCFHELFYVFWDIGCLSTLCTERHDKIMLTWIEPNLHKQFQIVFWINAKSMKGLCLKCFSSGVTVITNESNPEAVCEKCKQYWNIFKIS